jgi:ADP-heptose:LPS heptosyltransferase
VAIGPPRLVALRALGLGDLLTGIPALRALARAFPDHERVLAAPAPLAPLVPRDLARLVPAEPLQPLPRGLARADLAVNLHGSGPQSHRLLLDTRPRRLIGFEHPDVRATRGFPHWRPNEHEVMRWCRMLAEHGIPARPGELEIDPPPGPPPPLTRGATLVHAGAASAARRWPPRRFAAVARAELAAGRDVVITGGPGEERLAFEVAAEAGLDERRVLAGRMDLADLARAVAAAGRVVCGDTGVAHLATALGRPSVVLFGPTSPAEWGPPAERARHQVLWTGESGDPHATRPDGGLLQITVTDVLGALERLDEVSAARAG